MEYLIIIIVAAVAIIYRWKKSRFDSTEAVTGFIKHLIDKQQSYTHYDKLAHEQSIEAFAERLKMDHKLRMDKKLLNHANWLTIAEEIKSFLDQYLEDMNV